MRSAKPTQFYAAVAGVFLLVLGILSLVIEGPGFGTVGNVSDQPQFLIWATSGWTSIFWIVMGVLGLFALTRLGAARTYALAAGVVFAVVAVWGFISGDNAFGILAADTTNNITHAILAALGLLVGLMPWTVPAAPADAAEERVEAGRRFSRRPAEASARRPGQAAGHR